MAGSVQNIGICPVGRRRSLCFILCWCFGLLAGTLIAAGADQAVLSMTRLALYGRVSVVSLLMAALLPFMITACAVLIHSFRILYFCGFLQALSVSCCGFLVYRAMGTAGWLIQPMFQFTECVMSVVYCWFCLRCCIGEVRSIKRELLFIAVIAAAVVVMDLFAVSRFLAALLD